MNSLLDSTLNTRYLGNDSGQSLLIRSDKIDNCSENEIKFLSSHGIRNVIDLRDLSNKKTNPFLEKNDINLFNCPMPVKHDRDEFFKQYPNGDCFEYYVFLLSKYDRIRNFFEKIMLTNGGILFNCSAGRDRTGIISFLIELILDHNAEIISENMAISDRNLAIGVLHKDIRLASDLNYEKAKKRALRLYNWFLDEYMTIDNYFTVVFGSPNAYLKIKEKLFELCKNM